MIIDPDLHPSITKDTVHICSMCISGHLFTHDFIISINSKSSCIFITLQIALIDLVSFDA